MLEHCTLLLQDDIMYTNLTVEENLMFSARYRLPVHYTHSQHIYYVERAIQVSSMLSSFVNSAHSQAAVMSVWQF